jgi:hypothetical protein
VRVPPYQRRRGSRSFARWGHWPAKRRAGHAPAANVNKPKGHEPGGTLQEFRWDCRTFASAGAVPGVFHEGWATAGLCIQIFSRYKDFCLSGPHRSQLFAAAVEEAAVEEATAAALKEAGAVVSNPARAASSEKRGLEPGIPRPVSVATGSYASVPFVTGMGGPEARPVGRSAYACRASCLLLSSNLDQVCVAAERLIAGH